MGDHPDIMKTVEIKAKKRSRLTTVSAERYTVTIKEKESRAGGIIQSLY